MKWWDRMPWSLFSECWALSQLLTLHFHFHQEAFEFLFTFFHKGGVICISEVTDISPGNLDSSLCSSSPAFLMTYSAYKLNKQGDNIQPWQTPFPIWNQSVVPCPVLTCFLTCIQISQEADQVVWYSHLFQNFPQFIVIHTVKRFGIFNKAEIDVFLELSCFFHDPVDVGSLISGSSAFSKTSLNIRKSRFTYCWSLAWRILSVTLLACEMSPVVQQFEHALS